jgi:acyl-CoA thioester hydrolase
MSALKAGHFADQTHYLPIRIYYEDTDFSGVVYHASYLRFMERGRTEYLRLSGVGHGDLLAGETPLAFAVRRMQIDFLRPARIDDVLSVQTRFIAARGARIEAEQQVMSGENILVKAQVQIACIDLQGRPKRLPTSLGAQIAPFLTGN